MKILLTINPALTRSGYTNICPLGGEGNIADGYINLDQYAENGELEELVVTEALEFLDLNQLNMALTNWYQKIAYGGSVTIEGTDLRRVCNAFILQQITSEQVNRLIFGSQTNVFEFKKAGISINDIAQTMAQFGFKIVKKRIDGFRFVVTGERIK